VRPAGSGPGLIFHETLLHGSYLIELELISDARGYFARTWCAQEFADHGLNNRLAQCSTSYNSHAGTLRGMHFQTPPHEESKLVRCVRGAIYDVIIDLRPASPTHRSWIGNELTEENRLMLYVPEGFAHGFLTLNNRTEVSYQISVPFAPAFTRGVRWDDPAIGITLPEAVRVISERDSNFPDFDP
jgi:dTDP-4-dehydrorhamnose 3,5-epimerase